MDVPEYMFDYAIQSIREARNRVDTLPESLEKSRASVNLQYAEFHVDKLRKILYEHKE